MASAYDVDARGVVGSIQAPNGGGLSPGCASCNAVPVPGRHIPGAQLGLGALVTCQTLPSVAFGGAVSA
jgi:hypothetical protein